MHAIGDDWLACKPRISRQRLARSQSVSRGTALAVALFDPAASVCLLRRRPPRASSADGAALLCDGHYIFQLGISSLESQDCLGIPE